MLFECISFYYFVLLFHKLLVFEWFPPWRIQLIEKKRADFFWFDCNTDAKTFIRSNSYAHQIRSKMRIHAVRCETNHCIRIAFATHIWLHFDIIFSHLVSDRGQKIGKWKNRIDIEGKGYRPSLARACFSPVLYSSPSNHFSSLILLNLNMMNEIATQIRVWFAIRIEFDSLQIKIGIWLEKLHWNLIYRQNAIHVHLNIWNWVRWTKSMLGKQDSRSLRHVQICKSPWTIDWTSMTWNVEKCCWFRKCFLIYGYEIIFFWK